jgi:hypothetical protein
MVGKKFGENHYLLPSTVRTYELIRPIEVEILSQSIYGAVNDVGIDRDGYRMPIGKQSQASCLPPKIHGKTARAQSVIDAALTVLPVMLHSNPNFAKCSDTRTWFR